MKKLFLPLRSGVRLYPFSSNRSTVYCQHLLLNLLVLWVGFTPLLAQEQTLTYEASSENFPNPERGFAPSIDPPWAPTINWDFCGCTGYDWYEWTEPLEASTLRGWRAEGYSVVQIRYHLSEFRTKALSPGFVARLNEDFSAARQEGFKLIPRFTYNWPLGGPDATLAQVLSHIEQLKPIFEQNVDVINLVELGFIGCWGEQHSSCNGLVDGSDPNEKTWEIIEAMFDAIPQERMIAMRYPKVKFLYFNNSYNPVEPVSEAEAYTGTMKARWAHHDDCPTCGEWNLGTWQTPRQNAQEILDYLEQDNLFVAQGGEPGDPETDTSNDGDEDGDGWDTGEHADCDRMLWQLEKARWSTMNASYGGSFNNSAYNIWRDQGCYEEIAKRLGYRYQLTQAKVPEQAAPGSSLALSFTVANQGFASAHNPRMLEVILRNQQTGEVIPLVVTDGKGVPENHDLDPRFWQPGSETTVTAALSLPSDLATGDYEVLLNLADPLLYGRPEYSIRLANQDVWEPTTGYNKLNATVTITGDAPSPSEGAGLRGAYFDNKTLSGNAVLSRVDTTVNFNWQRNAPDPSLPCDNFSVRWTGQVQATHTGTYTFYTRSDDGVRLWVNGSQLVNDWSDHAARERKGTIDLQAGVSYDIRLEYYEKGGRAVCELRWSSDCHSKQIIPRSQLFPDNANAQRADLTTSGGPLPPIEPQIGEVTLYPNPNADGTFTVQGLSDDSQLTLYDLQGRSIDLQEEVVAPQRWQLRTRQVLRPGVYVLSVHHPNGQQYQQKLVVE